MVRPTLKAQILSVRPLTNTSSFVLFRVDPPSVLVLDALSYLVLTLCKGSDLDSLKRALVEATDTAGIGNGDVLASLPDVLDSLQRLDLVEL